MAKKGIALTGDRPTGKLHLGHYIGSIKQRVVLQDDYEQFVMVADMQALTHNAENTEKVRNSVLEVTLDNIAAGLDPTKTTFFIQSKIEGLAFLTAIFETLVTLGRLTQNPTVKTEMKEKGYGTNVPVGFLTHPISQAADILAFKPDIVPVGEDQLPMIEQTNEIAEKINRLYGNGKEIFKKVKASLPPGGEGARLPGIDGKAKMSKSLGNAIYLSDGVTDIEQKVMAMYTDPGHIHAQDPGKVEGNVVFTYLSIFDPNQNEVNELKKAYQKGGLGDVEIKKRLIGILNTLLDPIREKREYLAKKPEYILEVLKEGEKVAAARVNETAREVREAIGIQYY